MDCCGLVVGVEVEAADAVCWAAVPWAADAILGGIRDLESAISFKRHLLPILEFGEERVTFSGPPR